MSMAIGRFVIIYEVIDAVFTMAMAADLTEVVSASAVSVD